MQRFEVGKGAQRGGIEIRMQDYFSSSPHSHIHVLCLFIFPFIFSPSIEMPLFFAKSKLLLWTVKEPTKITRGSVIQ